MLKRLLDDLNALVTAVPCVGSNLSEALVALSYIVGRGKDLRGEQDLPKHERGVRSHYTRGKLQISGSRERTLDLHQVQHLNFRGHGTNRR